MVETWEERYRRLMGEIWQSPLNDQRPAILEFLRAANIQNRVTLDIGAGDAYYLPLLKPRKYFAVEPDDVWRFRLPYLLDAGVLVRTYRDVAAFLLNVRDVAETEVAVLCHALLYLADDEVDQLLHVVRKATIVIVHPDPNGATTIAFERSLGWEGSLRKIRMKECILGEPLRRVYTASSLYLPDATAGDDIAFLLSHRLPVAMQKEQMGAARAFVGDNAGGWKRDGWWRVPQPQVLELYAPEGPC